MLLSCTSTDMQCQTGPIIVALRKPDLVLPGSTTLHRKAISSGRLCGNKNPPSFSIEGNLFLGRGVGNSLPYHPTQLAYSSTLPTT